MLLCAGCLGRVKKVVMGYDCCGYRLAVVGALEDAGLASVL